MTLGSVVRSLRIRRGMTQAELAAEAGITRRQVIRIEAGQEPHLGTYARIVAALGYNSGDEMMRAARR